MRDKVRATNSGFQKRKLRQGAECAWSLGVAFRSRLGWSSGSKTLTELLEAELWLILPQNGDEKLGPTFQGWEGTASSSPAQGLAPHCGSNRLGLTLTWIIWRGAATLPHLPGSGPAHTPSLYTANASNSPQGRRKVDCGRGGWAREAGLPWGSLASHTTTLRPVSQLRAARC